MNVTVRSSSDLRRSRYSGPRHKDAMTYCAVIFTALAANANVSLKPILIGSYVEFLKFSASSAGYVLAAEATATSVGTALAALCVNRFSRRHLAIAALAIIAIGNLLSFNVGDIAVLAAVRAFTGLGHGIALAVTAASIANFKQPDRMAGVVTVSVSLFGMCLMLFIPWAQSFVGIQPLFLVMAGLIIPSFLLLSWIPAKVGSMIVLDSSSGSGQANSHPHSHRHSEARLIWITLVAAGFFYVSVGSFWPFTEQLGRAAGLDYQGATKVTAFAAMAAVLGALTAIALGNRFGRSIPIGFSISASIAGLVLLLRFPHSPFVFSTVAVVYMFCWATLYPFLLGFASQLDPRGRVNAFVFSLSLIGLAVGPGLASGVMAIGVPDGGSNLTNLVWMSALCLLPSFALLYAVRKHESTLKVTATTLHP
jgi:predicted MFS family arabinose efflux permease